ncbi:MAG: hypothetical protein AAGD10_17510 [Myxococcota bacterium]
MTLLVAGLLLVLLLGAGLLWRRSRKPLVCPPQDLTQSLPPSAFTLVPSPPGDEGTPKSPKLADQPEDWRAGMAGFGRRFRELGIDHIVFIHGTFVGNDPISVSSTLKTLAPSIDWSARVGPLLKGTTNLVFKDHGNFTPAYVRLAEEALQVPAHLFVWGSENHHLSRLRGALALIEDLQSRGPRRPLLIGHSHGGQVIALACQLLTECSHGPGLLEVCDANPPGLSLPRGGVDVVTLGTPPRYGWPRHPGVRPLHIVNHRGSGAEAGHWSGVLTTQDGDYVQQWGIEGSDTPSPSAPDRALNRALDRLLGPGHDPARWREALSHRRRVHDGGHTLLVDYGDRGRAPNLFRTNLGHATYTRQREMFRLFALVEPRLMPSASLTLRGLRLTLPRPHFSGPPAPRVLHRCPKA